MELLDAEKSFEDEQFSFELESIREKLIKLQAHPALQQGLLSFINEKSNKQLFGRIRKYLEHGRDLSSLYKEIMLLSSFNFDVEVKSVIYEFLVRFQLKFPDLSLMCLTSIQNDYQKSKDVNIRLLALRALFRFKKSEFVEYQKIAIRDGLLGVNLAEDGKNSIRNTCLNLLIESEVTNEIVLELDKLQLHELKSIDQLAKYFVLKPHGNKTVMMRVLTNLKHLSGRTLIKLLDSFCENYRDLFKEEKEVYVMMNLFNDYLESISLPVVLSVGKLFLILWNHIKKNMSEVTIPLFKSLSALYLCSTDSTEKFIIIKHLEFLLTISSYSEAIKSVALSFAKRIDIVSERDQSLTIASVRFLSSILARYKCDITFTMSVISCIFTCLNDVRDRTESEALVKCLLQIIDAQRLNSFEIFMGIFDHENLSLIAVESLCSGFVSCFILKGSLVDDQAALVAAQLNTLSTYSEHVSEALLWLLCFNDFENCDMSSIVEDILKTFPSLLQSLSFVYLLRSKKENVASFVNSSVAERIKTTHGSLNRDARANNNLERYMRLCGSLSPDVEEEYTPSIGLLLDLFNTPNAFYY